MKRYTFIALLFLINCGVFEDAYNDGIQKPTPNKKLFQFPGIANIRIIQDEVLGTVPSMKTSVVVEKKTDFLDSVEASILVFHSGNKSFENLIYRKKVRFLHRILDAAQKSDTATIESNQDFDLSNSLVHLAYAAPSTHPRFSGIFTGEYRSFKDSTVLEAGRLLCLVNYAGEVEILLDKNSAVKTLEGSLLSEDLAVFSVKDKIGETIPAASIAKYRFRSERLEMVATLIGHASLDSVQLFTKEKL